MLNDLFARLGIEDFKPLLTALVLPPVPLLMLMLLGAGQLRRRPGWGWLLLLTGAAGIWLSSTVAVGEALQQRLLGPPPPLSQQAVKNLQALRKGSAAIVVLGAGRERHAPEYGGASLNPQAMARLRYGLWLARETGLPLAFSGGVGHAQDGGQAEAGIAAAIAARDFSQPLKWTEGRSRDTRENAALGVAQLRAQGVTHIVLVTHGWHMRRAQRAFAEAIAQQGGGITLQPAPMGLARSELRPALRWLPSIDGFRITRQALHEYAGWLLGA